MAVTLDEVSHEPIAKPPAGFDRLLDRAFRGSTVLFAWLTIVLVLAIIFQITEKALPAFHEHGFSLATSTTWDPVADPPQYGILPEIWGTLYSSMLGLIIGSAFGLAI